MPANAAQENPNGIVLVDDVSTRERQLLVELDRLESDLQCMPIAPSRASLQRPATIYVSRCTQCNDRRTLAIMSDTEAVFNRASIAFLPLSYKKGLMLHVVPTTAVVRSDAALLERIVGNFLPNAVQYNDRGKIIVGCRSRGDSVAIQILDSGPGIPSSQADAIFDDFYQLHNEERDRGKGFGLGLAIVRRLAECLGHQIEHRSALGKGSYFGVVAERGKSMPELVKRDDFVEVSNELAGTRVLLIEDDITAADATALLLRSWNCVVWCARTTEKALQLVESRTDMPNINVADYRLPGKLDGVEAIQRIQIALQTAVPAIRHQRK